MKFHHVAVFVSDADRAIALWRDVLGFSVVVDRTIPDLDAGDQSRMGQALLDDIFKVEGATSRMVLLQSDDGAMIELQQPSVPAIVRTPPETLQYGHTGIHEVAFLVDDIDGWFERIRAAGYRTQTEYVWTWGVTGKSFLFYDDDGNMIQFNWQPRSSVPAWRP
ncbi:catechol 2,3-dioxygenase-like lactoylglutathione lyase family enzyme [Microbacterium resistens]|uniref:Catechol 2,3-dioxygenase-like lactoylglutathione lyase family enzyme n=1 Tax=Microbacterium resistens TaxID=156977 RepID=A0ABU1SEC9_9MICO|nr:VOC family protein [Microbacterium resistens]MDR6867603.1 catechol 2,3-dioxygenase-like lactoylglutathione lyase family enzyme [Microbacterium resistens]